MLRGPLGHTPLPQILRATQQRMERQEHRAPHRTVKNTAGGVCKPLTQEARTPCTCPLSDLRRAQVVAELEEWVGRSTASRAELQRLFGVLNWVVQVTPDGQTWLFFVVEALRLVSAVAPRGGFSCLFSFTRTSLSTLTTCGSWGAGRCVSRCYALHRWWWTSLRMRPPRWRVEGGLDSEGRHGLT